MYKDWLMSREQLEKWQQEMQKLFSTAPINPPFSGGLSNSAPCSSCGFIHAVGYCYLNKACSKCGAPYSNPVDHCSICKAMGIGRAGANPNPVQRAIGGGGGVVVGSNLNQACSECGAKEAEYHHKDCVNYDTCCSYCGQSKGHSAECKSNYSPHYLEPKPAPASAKYICLQCNNNKLTQEDLNVNPATGNIWGCYKCGSKKLERVG